MAICELTLWFHSFASCPHIASNRLAAAMPMNKLVPAEIVTDFVRHCDESRISMASDNEIVQFP
jgi:hypothetical protein